MLQRQYKKSTYSNITKKLSNCKTNIIFQDTCFNLNNPIYCKKLLVDAIQVYGITKIDCAQFQFTAIVLSDVPQL